jgi:NAD+ kinase
MTMHRIGIIANPVKQGIAFTVEQFVNQAVAQGMVVCLEEDLRTACKGKDVNFRPADEIPAHCDIVVALGGDGTILRAARTVRASQIPILGVNLGRLGFLAGAAPEELEKSILRLKSGEYQVEERLGLEAELDGKNVFALNEFVIEKGVLARMVQVKTWISDTPISSFFGNGLIVATPTGSTSYNLSAGGPILHPSIEAFIATPICPHSLTLRPVVVPSNQSITVQVVAEHTDIMVTADGQTLSPLAPESKLVIRRAPYPTRLINLEGIPFYQLLRQKLDWSMDRRDPQE